MDRTARLRRRVASPSSLHALGSARTPRPHHGRIAVMWAARRGRPGRSSFAASPRAGIASQRSVPGEPGVIQRLLVRRDVMLEIGGYRTDLRLAEDFDVWLRVLERGTGVALPTVVSLYHRHSEQKSTRIDDGRTAQRRAIDARVESDWYSKTLVRRRAVVDDWDDLRGGRALRLSGLRHVAGTPVRLAALAQLLRWRGQRRRRNCSIARDGGPTVAVLRGTPDEVVVIARSRPTIDLREYSWLRSCGSRAKPDRPGDRDESPSRRGGASARHRSRTRNDPHASDDATARLVHQCATRRPE